MNYLHVLEMEWILVLLKLIQRNKRDLFSLCMILQKYTSATEATLYKYNVQRMSKQRIIQHVTWIQECISTVGTQSKCDRDIVLNFMDSVQDQGKVHVMISQEDVQLMEKIVVQIQKQQLAVIIMKMLKKQYMFRQSLCRYHKSIQSLLLCHSQIADS
ncbi:unnamed protein product [Paramecium pentaurelia]|uniref:Uncharacterized protein n=1 Tax=Paramecium pentaurelia TaxID=43138 RepID=A0A8S1XPL6_9CILI|nr:unnamed protein product [Paramecium pentaurelia]